MNSFVCYSRLSQNLSIFSSLSMMTQFSTLSPQPLPLTLALCLLGSNQHVPVSKAVVTIWVPPVSSALRKLPTGCESSCDPRSEVSPSS